MLASKEVHLSICKEHYVTIPTVIYLKKDFYLKSELNGKIGRIIETGLMHLWQIRMVDERRLSYVDNSKTRKALSYEHLSGIFFVWFVGCFTSSVVLLAEVTIDCIMKKLGN